MFEKVGRETGGELKDEKESKREGKCSGRVGEVKSHGNYQIFLNLQQQKNKIKSWIYF